VQPTAFSRGPFFGEAPIGKSLTATLSTSRTQEKEIDAVHTKILEKSLQPPAVTLHRPEKLAHRVTNSPYSLLETAAVQAARLPYRIHDELVMNRRESVSDKGVRRVITAHDSSIQLSGSRRCHPEAAEGKADGQACWLRLCGAR
jgi:hypothetical protein